MSGDACEIVNLNGAHVQENGIIRLGDGYYIGRLDEISYEAVVERQKNIDAKNAVTSADETFDFGRAIATVKAGKKVARKGWNGKGIFIELQRPDKLSKMTHPYIYIDTTGLKSDNPHAPRSLVPWLASQTDMLAEDWVIVLD